MYQISTKLVHAFGLQTPITAECTVALAWQTHHGGHVGDMMGCDHPIWVPVGRLVGELWHFEYISNMAAVCHFEFKKNLIFDLMTVIAVLTCCSVPNFIKIGSRVRPPDIHNYRMFNASLLGNGRCHGNRIVGDMSGS